MDILKIKAALAFSLIVGSSLQSCTFCTLVGTTTGITAETILSAWELEKEKLLADEEEVRALEYQMEPKLLEFARLSMAIEKLHREDIETLDALKNATRKNSDLNGLEINSIIERSK